MLFSLRALNGLNGHVEQIQTPAAYRTMKGSANKIANSPNLVGGNPFAIKWVRTGVIDPAFAHHPGIREAAR